MAVMANHLDFPKGIPLDTPRGRGPTPHPPCTRRESRKTQILNIFISVELKG